MNEMDKKDALLKDLELIKEAVKKNSSILKLASISEGIKLTALLSGVFIFLLGIIVLWLEHAYGSYHQIPGTIKLVLYTTIGAVSIGLALTKIKGMLAVMKKYRENMNLMHLIQELYTRRVIMIVVPYIIAITVLVVYFSVSRLSHLIIPFLAVLTSMVFLALDSVFNVRGILLSCFWMLFSGLISLFFAETVHTVILLFATFGVGMLILYGSAQFSSSREKRDGFGG